MRLNPGLGGLVGTPMRLWTGAKVGGDRRVAVAVCDGMEVALLAAALLAAALIAAALPFCMHPMHPIRAMAIPIPMLMAMLSGALVG